MPATATPASATDETVTALAALKLEGIDPTPYFALVADNLMQRFGLTALQLADAGASRMVSLGDAEGAELWREIRAALVERITFEDPESQPH